MDDYISREAAIEAVCRRCHYEFPEAEPCGDCLVKTAIMAVPAADAKRVRQGKWIEDDYGFNSCSECGYEWDESEYKTLFCPECGAKMDLEDDQNED